MIRGLYSAAAGMLAQFQRQETVSNNLANVNTPGFKRDFAVLREAPEVGEVRSVTGLLRAPYPVSTQPVALGVVGTGAMAEPMMTDFSNGDVRETGQELDLALVGPGYFEMRAPDGRIHYSRGGEFSRDAAGRLVDGNGAFLMGDDGPVRVGQGEVTIDPDGTVWSDGEEVGVLRVMDFPPDARMRKIGDNGLVPVDPALQPRFVGAETIVQQGAIEGSNVDPGQAVVEMMAAMRSYEAAQRLVQINDQLLERAVNDIGRV